MLPKGELGVKHGKLEGKLDSVSLGDSGTIDGDRKLTDRFPSIQVECSACSFGCAQPEPPCR